ncbi:MAG: ATP-binding cassette domain-containing protein [Bacilli bacterium]|nr:ATP-binding cassette domain-containing protein [Bacilli bacterium]MCH4210938.1 ATP-binding cassette domain-containing protein [Bacilli bacterium]MCH4229080.1 ATP-binding cassette domain-containing protein [Bacilli bacterium]MCH4277768.1 ATP-binding cassette domain-containing protein [Bacilli bacterium]MCI2054988.1 ATP-binding cassette domain-containing protein [Bacilli bacterium]
MLIQAKNLTKEFNDGEKTFKALDSFSYDFPNSGFYFIVGKSGSGKSTLLSLLGGLAKPTSGTIEEKPGIRRNFVFQDENFIFSLSLMDNLKLVNEDENRIEASLNKVGLLNKIKTPVSSLSKGERARLAVCKAILSDADVIFLDEPTGNLDEANSETVFSILKELSKTILVICVTHDVESASQYADVILSLADGKLNDVKLIHEVVEKPLGEKKQTSSPKIPFKIGFRYALKQTGPSKLKFWMSLINLALTGAMMVSSLSLAFINKGDVVQKAANAVDIDHYSVQKISYSADETITIGPSNGVDYFNELSNEACTPSLSLSSSSLQTQYCIYEDSRQKLEFDKPDYGKAVLSDYFRDIGHYSVGDQIEEGSFLLTIASFYSSGYSRYDYVNYSTPIKDNCLRSYVSRETYSKLSESGYISWKGEYSNGSRRYSPKGVKISEYSNEEIVSGRLPENDNEIIVNEFGATKFAGSKEDRFTAVGGQLTTDLSGFSGMDFSKHGSNFTICGVFKNRDDNDSSEPIYLAVSSTLWSKLKEQIYYANSGTSFAIDKDQAYHFADLINSKKCLLMSNYDNYFKEADFFFQIADAFKTVFLVSSLLFLLLGLSFLFSYCSDNMKKAEKDVALFKLMGKKNSSINAMFVFSNSLVVMLAFLASAIFGFFLVLGIGLTVKSAYSLPFNPLSLSPYSLLCVALLFLSIPALISIFTNMRLRSCDIAVIFKRNLV